MKTLLDALKEKYKMPTEIWDGHAGGPISYDDPFEIWFLYQEKEHGPVIHGTIQLEIKSIKTKER